MNGMNEDTISVRVVDSSSGRSLTAWVREIGDDVVVAVGGGDRPHVGCVVLADAVAEKLAEATQPPLQCR